MSAVTHPLKDVVYTWFSERRWTEQEYLLFANDQNALIELSDGKVVIHEMPTPQHQAVVLNIAARLREYPGGRTLVAPVPVQLWSGKMREPDVVVFKIEHLDRIGEQFAGVPDLVIEVLSPSARSIDLGDKMDEYARAGIAEYWIVEIDAKNVSVYVLREGSYQLANRYRDGEVVRSVTIAGLSLPVNEIFR